ncbi:MAG: hypothetical protein ABGY75_14585 [Gemmataceae bacterium]
MPLPKRRNQELVSAPTPLTIGDRTFLVVPPSEKDTITIYRWARQHIRECKPVGLSSEELAGLSPEDKAFLLKEYAKTAKGKRQITEQDIQDLLFEPEGLAFMIWVSAKKQEPSLKLEEVKALVTEDNCDQVFADFGEATGHEDREGHLDPKAPSPPSSSPASPAA